MERLIYFFDKLWTFVVTINPLSYLTLFIVSGILFFIFKWTIQKIRPQTIRKNLVAVTLTILVALPILGLLLYLIVGLVLKDQQF